ncbi:leucine-rich repeat-containing protein 59 [Diachasma alloeum]|uniref:leucine-rich repeat-containing protein 59 n=1 Tax=Diachasma alloeum TaxID=454923 RepID=UPI00073820B4|nr:leucine-rich repeat-containing protein 59 [Diachasma alloeum]
MTVKIKVKDKLEDETLDLSWCDLKEVPIKEIATIKKASHLDLSNNQLVSIPKTIVSLTHIVKLDLSKNLLTEIPENIGEMKQLKYLDLYSNQISRLPLSMGDLKNLKWLDLKDNPLTSAVASIAGPCSNTVECQQCARSIVSYLTCIRQMIEEEKKRRNEASTAASAPAAPSKKESKKKKKKNNVKDEKQNQKEADVKSSASHGSVVDRKTQLRGQNRGRSSESSSGGVCKSLCRMLCSTLTFIIFLGILSVFAGILLPRFNQPLSDKVFTYLEDQTKLPVKEYQKLGIEKFDASAEVLMTFLNRTKTLASETFAKIIGEQHKCCGN